jgi:hypothetical protein
MNELKTKYGYDKFFHLGLIATLENGTELILQKNETIDIDDKFKPDDGAEYLDIDMLGKKITLNQFLENGKKKFNPEYKYYEYNFENNNCQIWILNLLLGSSLLTNSYRDFIYQDVKELTKQLPNKGIINTMTDIGAVVSQLKGGKLKKKEIIL